MNLKSWPELEIGGINSDAGNSLKSADHHSRRRQKPQFDATNCINCFFCWVFCPENVIILTEDKVTGINYDFCKGCGICVNECPVQKKPAPLVMVEEEAGI